MKHLVLSLIIFLTLGSSWALPDESLYQIPSQWSNHEGQYLFLKDLAGSPRLMVMLYTRCTTTCPLVLDDIKAILGDLPPEAAKAVRVTVVSFDSERETPETLKDFYTKKGLDSRWSLLRGDSAAVSTLAAALGVRYKKVGEEYIHSNIIFLVDANGVVRAKKEGLKTSRVDFVSQVKTHLATL
jgi:protein SCO1/2